MTDESGAATVTDDTAGLVQLLGALAYGELSAFERLSQDSRLAPTLSGRAELAGMAAEEIGHYHRIADRLRALGADPEQAMVPFVDALDRFHAGTEPSDYLEGLIKAYIGDGLAADLYREVAQYVDQATRELILEVLADEASAQFAVREVRAAIAANPSQAGRLALWGRRLVGEARSQSQHVLAEHDELMMLLIRGSADASSIATTLDRITERHSERMATLGLADG